MKVSGALLTARAVTAFAGTVMASSGSLVEFKWLKRIKLTRKRFAWR